MKGERSALVLVVLLVGVAVLWWAFSGPSSTAPLPQQNTANASGQATIETLSSLEPIVVHHATRGGDQIYSGSLATPSPCDVLSTGVTTTGTSVRHVTLVLGVFKPDAACAVGASALQPFSVSITADKNSVAFDAVEVNGARVSYRLVEDK